MVVLNAEIKLLFQIATALCGMGLIGRCWDEEVGSKLGIAQIPVSLPCQKKS